MANPYDQFDEVQPRRLPPATGAPKTLSPEDREFFNQNPSPLATHANPYDQFDDQGPPIDSTGKRDYQAWEVLPQTIGNIPGSAANFIGGMWQAVTHPIETAKNVGMMVGGAPMTMLTPDVQQMIAKDSPLAAEMMQTARAVGGAYAERYGSWEALERTMVEDPVGFAADLSSFLTGGGGAARGAGVAAGAAGATGTAATANRLAAGLGTVANHPLVNPTRVVEMGAQGAGHLGRAAVNLRAPQGQMLVGATEGRGQDVLNALRAPNTGVSTPHAGQAVAEMPGVPTQWQALVKAAEGRRPTEFYGLKGDQNAERLAEIQSIGRTPADLDAAIAARDAASRRDYAAADPVVSTADDTLMELMGRPSMDRVMARARELAAERGVDFEVRPHTPAASTPSSVLGPDGNPVMVNTPEVLPQWEGRQLHIVKQAFDDLIANPERFGIGASEVRAIRGTRNQFIDWFEDTNPAYRTARENYAAASRPIDQMQIGQWLERQLLSPTLGDDTPALRADSFSRAIQEAPMRNTSIRRATGQQRYNNLDEIFTPDQMRVLNSIRDDLARDKMYENQAKAARQYSGELTSNPETLQAPSLLNARVTVLNALARQFAELTRGRISDEVANAMRDPAAAAGMLEDALNRDGRINRLSENLHGTGMNLETRNLLDLLTSAGTIAAGQYGRVIRGVNRLPAVYNVNDVLEEDKKKRNNLRP